MKHSKGPWHVGKVGDSRWRDAICAGPHCIARVVGSGYPVGKGWHPESEANARLIAAAPDMLQALKVLIERSIILDECGDIVRAAIAKAEGEAA